MIKLFPNSIDDNSIEKLIKFYNRNKGLMTNNFQVTRYPKEVFVLPIEKQSMLDFFEITKSFPMSDHVSCFLQNHKDTISVYDKYHSHPPNWTYVYYLNDNFEKGELWFEHGYKYKPTKGDLLCFTADEVHSIQEPINFTKGPDRRWTIAGMMKPNTKSYESVFGSYNNKKL